MRYSGNSVQMEQEDSMKARLHGAEQVKESYNIYTQ
jgi:hypothetical protein